MSAADSSEPIKTKIKAEAFRLGFSFCGFTTAEPPAEYFRYETWLRQGFHAGMDYLNTERHRESRRNPAGLMPSVKTILSLGWRYPLRQPGQRDELKRFLVAGYAAGADYHLLLAEKTLPLIEFISKELGGDVEAKFFTDSAPILERELAMRAGLGWIGRNSCLISPQFGSSFLLAEIFLSADIVPDKPFTREHCGRCRRCIDACPTHCILSDRTIDTAKCISYLTIEHKGVIPASLHPSVGNWLFGCDVCQMVCPWNQKPSALYDRSGLLDLSIEETVELLWLDKTQFTARFRDSAIFRTKWNGLLRNALIVLGNSSDPLAWAGISRFVDCCDDPHLAEMAKAILSQSAS